MDCNLYKFKKKKSTYLQVKFFFSGYFFGALLPKLIFQNGKYFLSICDASCDFFFIKKLLGCRHFYGSCCPCIGLPFFGTVFDERVRACDRSPDIEIFRTGKFCFQTNHGSLRWDYSLIGTVTGGMLFCLAVSYIYIEIL